MRQKIIKLDYDGRGIVYVDGKITFIPKVLPEEEVEFSILEENKHYNLAEGTVISESEERIPSVCPYYDVCDGCQFFHVSRKTELEIKKKALEEQLSRIGYTNSIEVVAVNDLEYRNKVTLKVQNGKFGYYQSKSHNFIPIEKCLLLNSFISDLLLDFSFFHFNNGEIMIRSNKEGELILNLITEDEFQVHDDLYKKHAIKGIIKNHEILFGEDFYNEIINNITYQVSLNSFFQINREVASVLFSYLKEHTMNANHILDLYCGAGAISLQLASSNNQIIGIEVVEEAIKKAKQNAQINKIENVTFYAGKVEHIIKKLNEQFDCIVVDPPRAGLDRFTIRFLNEQKANQLIYVSCNPKSLLRDLKLLDNYSIELITAFDMFPKTKNMETVIVLKNSIATPR